MEAASRPLLLLRPHPPFFPRRRRRRLTLSPPPPPAIVTAPIYSSSSSSPPSPPRKPVRRGPAPQEQLKDWVARNDAVARALPIAVGAAGLLLVLLNRAATGIAPVADASSSPSRADILTLFLSIADIFTGLVWLSIRPKYIAPVSPSGIQCKRLKPGLGRCSVHELLWTWDAISEATCCKSLVVVYGGNCLLQIGTAASSVTDQGDATSVDMDKLKGASLYKSAMDTKKQIYLANLALYPGRDELPFLPPDTQALILQPVGDGGLLIVGGDTIRGFVSSDQAWITLIAEKLDATLSKS